MLQLFIDKGNTALKWQLVAQASLVQAGVVSNERLLEDEWKTLATQRLSGIYVSSVGSDEFRAELIKWAEKNAQPLPVFIESTDEICGVLNAYKQPERLGIDRWLAMIAAHNKYSGTVCIVDSGTALTMDFVLASGEHLGGFIVPGAALMKRSLLDNTQKIQLDDKAKQGQLGKSTSEAVNFGIEQMLQAFVQGKVLEVESKYQQKVTVVLTGGHASDLMDRLCVSVELEKDLVLQGLKLVVKQSQ